MAFMNDGSALLDYTSSGAATNQTKVYRVTCPTNEPDAAGFFLAVDLTQSGGATSPVAALYVDLSPDGTSWVSVNGVSTTGSLLTGRSASTNIAVAKYIRIRLEVGGGTAPAVVARAILFGSIGFDITEIV